jgi:integrase
MRIVPETHLACVLGDFTTYLISQRGLAQGTIHWYRYVAHQFLSTCGISKHSFEGLTTDKVTAFILTESRRRSVGSLNNVAVALRAFLRFLYLQGHTPLSLAAAVLPVPSWRDTGLARALSEQQIARLLASCDRQTNAGRRDFAILTLLARLGLRSQEVASLTLDDVDWRSGEILVAGKGNRRDRLPLPVDVGEALADYCHRARLGGNYRALFLHVRAPYIALSNSSISEIVTRACSRAGLPPAGAHHLRHSAATAMRRAGAPLLEIGQVLRHRRPKTTARYAKDDHDALAGVARRWPGGGAL